MKKELEEQEQIPPIDQKMLFILHPEQTPEEMLQNLKSSCRLRWQPLVRIAYDQATKSFLVKVDISVYGQIKKVRLYVEHALLEIDPERLQEFMEHDFLWSHALLSSNIIWKDTLDSNGKSVAAVKVLEECKTHAELFFEFSAHALEGKIFQIRGEYFCCEDLERAAGNFLIHLPESLKHFEENH